MGYDLEKRPLVESDVVEALDILLGAVSNILIEVFGIKKNLVAQFGSHLLTMQ